MEKFPAIILAGGRSTRMGGGDKCLIELGGKPIISHIVDRIAAQAAPIALNANDDPARFDFLGLPVIPDSLPDHQGPLAGVLAGMDWAAGLGAESVVTVACDTPFFPADLVKTFVQARGKQAIALAASVDENGTETEHPTFGLWSVALRDPLRDFLISGQRRVRGFTALYKPAIAVWTSGPTGPFFNINTPEDLAQAYDIAARKA